ncbi:aldehyde dehydrogenase [Paenibacillus spiritus]|uniref:Aldehyde dehydrogenase n=1 Tax=Paenibacillus spiritus TaxID=2496557 RepID=A0A5J5GMF0_9BACL|nr:MULTISPECIES: aldehyde dehydrogenase [Paenibacillus]KAA9008672.1 aldehyde dehydrogenase [Paenibacillus spiritus]
MNSAGIGIPDTGRMLQEHRQYFESGQTLPVGFRVRQLQKLREAILRHERDLAEALRLDLGKSEFEAYTTEIGFTLSSIRDTIRHLPQWARTRRVATPLRLFLSSSRIRHEPYGTALIIGPYNYPFQLLIEPLIGAIAAGNCAVLKPSEMTPRTEQVLGSLIGETFDPAYIRVVSGGVDTVTALLDAPFDFIFFTGSVPVGRVVMQAAAKRLTPVALELGGKSPAIVDETARLDAAAKRIVWGKMTNAGQTCVAPDYVAVHASVKDELIARIQQTLREFYGERPEQSPDFGRIVNDRHWTRLNGLLERERSAVLAGGDTDREARYIGPTLIEADFRSPSMEDELFGPLLPVLTYTDLDQLLAEIRRRPKPLALYLFTGNRQTEKRVLDAAPSGGVSINDTITHLANPKLPFGGVGPSGMGQYHGRYSFLTFSRERSVLRKSTRVGLPLLFPPYSAKKLKWIKRLLK